MNILIDATAITKNKAGVGIYAKNLIKELLKLPSDNFFFILAQDDDAEMHFEGYQNVKIIKVYSKLFRKLPLRFLLEQVGIPVLVRKYRIDILHSLHYSFPLLRSGGQRVVTIHDMTSFTMPEVHLRIKVIYFRFFAWAAVHFADKLIFVSNSTRDDCRTILGEPKSQPEVIYLGISPHFKPDLNPLEIQIRLNQYRIPARYVLYVGTIEPRKNLVRLVNAFAVVAAKYSDIYLVIAGMKGWMYEELFQRIKKLGIESKVIFTGYVAEDDKPYLLAGALAFAYPSLYEGFGIPVLEALACGTPTVTSNVSSLPEVAGNAAILIDPHSESELAEALEKLVSDTLLRGALRKRSIVQSRQFSWTLAAQRTLELYYETYSRSRTNQ